MEWLRRRWWLPLIALVLCAAAIYALAPRYDDAQLATDADAFRRHVADAGADRTTAAGALDMVFVASYLLLAAALLRANVASRVGAALIALAAVADVSENGSVIAAIAQGRDVNDNTVDMIRRFGAVKWTFVLAGGLVMLIGLVLSRRSTRP